MVKFITPPKKGVRGSFHVPIELLVFQIERVVVVVEGVEVWKAMIQWAQPL
jgi:hypothetical protein